MSSMLGAAGSFAGYINERCYMFTGYQNCRIQVPAVDDLVDTAHINPLHQIPTHQTFTPIGVDHDRGISTALQIRPMFPSLGRFLWLSKVLITLPLYLYCSTMYTLRFCASHYPRVASRTYIFGEQDPVEYFDKDEEFDEMRSDRNTYVKLRHVEPSYVNVRLVDRVDPDPEFPVIIAQHLGYWIGNLAKWIGECLVPRYESTIGEEKISMELARQVASDIRTDAKEEIVFTRFLDAANRAANTIALDRDFVHTHGIIDNTARYLAANNYCVVDRHTHHLNAVAVIPAPVGWPQMAVWGAPTQAHLNLASVTASVFMIGGLTYQFASTLISRFTVLTAQLPQSLSFNRFTASTLTDPSGFVGRIPTQEMWLRWLGPSHIERLLSPLKLREIPSGVSQPLLIFSALLLSSPSVRNKLCRCISTSLGWIKTKVLRMR